MASRRQNVIPVADVPTTGARGSAKLKGEGDHRRSTKPDHEHAITHLSATSTPTFPPTDVYTATPEPSATPVPFSAKWETTVQHGGVAVTAILHDNQRRIGRRPVPLLCRDSDKWDHERESCRGDTAVGDGGRGGHLCIGSHRRAGRTFYSGCVIGHLRCTRQPVGAARTRWETSS